MDTAIRTSPGTDAIDRETRRLRELIADAEGFTTEAAMADDLVAAFPQLGLRCSIGVGSGVLQGFLVMVDLHRLDEATALVAWLAQRLGKFEISCFPQLGRRTYDWKRFKLNAFFNAFDEKTVCTFVEVGKKEEPVYELRCRGEAQNAATQHGL